jgi:hypothetical protein
VDGTSNFYQANGYKHSFLVRCADWIGEGRHLDLLEAILSYGFDATVIHASSFEDWPVTCSTDWCGGGGTPDPFFVEYIGTILKYSPSKLFFT